MQILLSFHTCTLPPPDCGALKSDEPNFAHSGVCLQDLTFIEDGNRNKVDNLINFSKHKLVYDVISRLEKFQKSGYNFQRVEEIQNFLNTPIQFDDKQLYDLSLKACLLSSLREERLLVGRPHTAPLFCRSSHATQAAQTFSERGGKAQQRFCGWLVGLSYPAIVLAILLSERTPSRFVSHTVNSVYKYYGATVYRVWGTV